MASRTPLYAFAADGEVYPCQNPKNTALCQALLDKSETYGHTGRDYYKRKNYRFAAEDVTVLPHSIPHTNFADYTEIVGKISGYFGPKTAEFVIDWCKAHPPTPPSRPSIYQQMHRMTIKCACPVNQPVYEAVILKAASYPAEKKYHREAYLNAAAALAALKVSLRDDYNAAFTVASGPKTEAFIYEAARSIFPIRHTRCART